MNLGICSYITSAGLKAVTSAGVLGPYFAIKYFIPIYDYRLDRTICRGVSGLTSAVSVSSLNLVSATHSTLFGEKIYANGNYSLSENQFLYWDSDMGSLVDGVNNNVPSQQSVTTDITFESGKPLSVVVSGSKFESLQEGFFNISGTHQYTAGEVSTFNPLSAASWPLSAFYRVAGYTPNENGLTSATGTFKCRIPPSTGSFKFNGLALYAVKVDGNGFDDYGNGSTFGFNPTLFSVILFDQAQYKEDSVGGINDFEISVDLGFDWNVITSGTSAVAKYIETNYWVKMPTSTSTSAYGLSYDGDVVISSSAVAGSYQPRAKLTVTDPYQTQMRLANDNGRFTDFRTIRFSKNLSGPVPNTDDRAVMSIDTSCPDDSLIQIGYKTSALGIKSVAIGCYTSALGYTEGIAGFNGDGGYTVAVGVNTIATGFGSIALGNETSSFGYLNFAGGDNSIAATDNTDPDERTKSGLNFAYGKEVSAISRAYGGASFDYGSLGDIFAEDESYGSNIAFGVRSLSKGGLSFVNGSNVSATGVNAFGLGYNNLAKGHFSFVGGINSFANSDINFVYGSGISAYSPMSFGYGRNILLGDKDFVGSSTFNIALGDSLSATNHHAIALGSYAVANALNSIAIGQNYYEKTYATGVNSLAIGCETSAHGLNSIAIGYKNKSDNTKSISIGSENISNGMGSIAIGYKVSASGMNSLAMSNDTSASGNTSQSFGYKTLAAGDYSTTFGEQTTANGKGSFAGGFFSSANGNYSLAFGKYAKTDFDSSIALGYEAKSLYEKSIAIGAGAETTQENQIVLGSCDTDIVLKGRSISIGGGCNSNVSIPGISQFNDSMMFFIQMYGDKEKASESPKRTIKLDLYRASTGIRSVTMQETGYNTNRFVILNVQGTVYCKVHEDSAERLYKLVPGLTVVCAARTFSYKNNQVNNMLVSIDKGFDYFYITTAETLEVTNLDYVDYNSSTLGDNFIYAGKFDCEGGSQTEHHDLYWIPGMNILKAYINYDKNKVVQYTTVNTVPSRGDGICSYDILSRVYSENSLVNVVGLTNDWVGAYINNDGQTGWVSSTGWSNKSILYRESGVGGNGLKASGSFTNSGNISIGSPINFLRIA